MTNLLPPNSWPERKSKELHEVLPKLVDADKNQFVYIGCCMDFTAETMDELDEANDEKWPGDEDAVELMRKHCAGFDKWCETMGYVLDPSEGLTIANDSTLSYGKSYFRGVPCYWVDHSRIEYIWADREYLKLIDESMERASKTMTGRIDCSKSNLSAKPRSHVMRTHDDLPTEFSTPAEKAKFRAAAKRVPHFSMIAHSSQEMRMHAMYSEATIMTAKQVKGFGNDLHAMSIVPLAISMTDMDKWGCPYCGYSQGKIPATAEGTLLWVCLSCTKGSHILRDGLKESGIAFLETRIFPRLTNHPREGQPKHSERRVTKSHEQDSDSQDNRPEGGGDSTKGQ